MKRLSKSFTLEEFLKNSHHITLNPSRKHIDNLESLCKTIMQPLRDRYGKIIISSGYRNEELNDLVGGEKNSKHLEGKACDFIVKSEDEDLFEVFMWIKTNINLGRAIIYLTDKAKPRFIHVNSGSEGLFYANFDDKYYDITEKYSLN